jgi:hypothetical protein
MILRSQAHLGKELLERVCILIVYMQKELTGHGILIISVWKHFLPCPLRSMFAFASKDHFYNLI